MYGTPPPTKPVPVRLPADMARRIDRLRGLIPREAYVRDLLDKAIKRELAKQHGKARS